ncbi:restriction endonuclease [Streptomyces virginiae]
MTTAANGRTKKRKPADAAFWLAYEMQVAALVQALDANASITHDKLQVGALSGVARQIDALAVGSIAGQTLSVVFEAKCYGRRVSIGTVDEFIGKLLDLGAERGILYAAGGFTEGAVRRAERALNPRVGLEHLSIPLPDGVEPEAPQHAEDSSPILDRRPPIVDQYMRRDLRRDDSVNEWGRVIACGPGWDEPYEPSVATTTSYRAFLLGEAFLYKP